MNANSVSMENAETKIKCQKQQFLSKVLLGLMTFSNEKNPFKSNQLYKLFNRNAFRMTVN